MEFKPVHVQNAVQSHAQKHWKEPFCLDLSSASSKWHLKLQYLNILSIVYRIWPVLFLAEKIDDPKVFNTSL